MNKNRASLIFFVILLAGNVFFAFEYFTVYGELQKIKSEQAKIELNQKVLDFASLFINKVLQADKEVDFETRRSLENAVRDLKDKEIMAEWESFTSSKTELEAQNSVKRLLGIFITKIQNKI